MPAASVASVQSPAQGVDYPRVGLLSLGHLTNDLYGNLITALMPYLVLAHEISATLAGFILLTYLIGSSILQPIFGHHADRSDSRLLVVIGPLWVAVAACLIGWAGNAAVLFTLAVLAGIGTAAFHPQGAAMVGPLSGDQRGWAMSIFSMGGNVGFALGPVLAALIALVGLHWSPVLVFPALGVTVLLAVYAPRSGLPGQSAGAPFPRAIVKLAWRPLSLIVAVIATRSAVQYAMIFFLPLYYHERGYSAQLGSYYAFVLSLAGALGGLAGGRLSDRFGRKLIVVSTLLLTVPLLYLALAISGPLVWFIVGLSGGLLLASNSVTVVQGQELLPQSTGIASGVTLGLGFGLSGLLATALTALSDHIGVQPTIHLVPLLALSAAVLGALVPDRAVLLSPKPSAAH